MTINARQRGLELDRLEQDLNTLRVEFERFFNGDLEVPPEQSRESIRGQIASLQSAVEGVFNNAHILQLDYAAEYDVEKVEEQAGEYLLNLKAKTKTVAYDRLRIWADRKNVLPTRIECLTEANMLSNRIEGAQPTRAWAVETWSLKS